MKVYIDCMPCFIRQALESVKLVTDDEMVQEQVVRRVPAFLHAPFLGPESERFLLGRHA